MRAMKERRHNQDRNASTSKTQLSNKGTVDITYAEVHNSETNKDSHTPPLPMTGAEDFDLELFSDTIMNDALTDLQQVDLPTINAQALQLFSDVDDAVDNDNNWDMEEPIGINSTSVEGIAGLRNAVSTVGESPSISLTSKAGDTLTVNPDHQQLQPPGSSSNIMDFDSPINITPVNANAVTPESDTVLRKNDKDTNPGNQRKGNLDTESDNDTVIYSSDTGTPLLAEDSEHDINLNTTTDHTNHEDNPSDSEFEELTLHKYNSRTYFHEKKALESRTTTCSSTVAKSILGKNINMSDNDTGADLNMELLNLSDTFADNLVIRDLEELMDESESTKQIILPTRPRPQSPRGSFMYRFQGIRRKSSTPVSAGENKYKCPACPRKWNTRGEMCEHYRNSHPPLPCTDCNMTFTSPLSLARHSYKHKERPYECETCGEKFAFNSELTQHSPVHKEWGGFFCMANKCGKSFIRKGDLSVHVLTHTGPLLRCEIDAECTYSTRNPRLYKAHLNTHTRRKKYSCKRCGEEFNYTQQVKRHVEKYHA